MIPDFVLQLQEIQRNLLSQSLITQESWKDSVSRRFYDTFINQYEEVITVYINGGHPMRGKGLNDLLVFLDQKQNEMTQLTGSGLNIQAAQYGKIHDQFERERNPWGPEHEGYYDTNRRAQPGDLNSAEIAETMRERENTNRRS
jgi:hypothetical protein